MNLLCLIPFCQRDLELTRKLLLWIAELDGKIDQPCLLLADSEILHETKLEIKALAQEIFNFVEMRVVTLPKGIVGWPKASNYMFREAMWAVSQCYKIPFLWLEPDCVPIQRGWLSTLAYDYQQQPKRFMGAFVTSDVPGDPPVHMPGCAIYPQNAYDVLTPKHNREPDQTCNCYYCGMPTAWDYCLANTIVPRAYETKLIQHFWGTHELCPTFVQTRQPNSPKNALPFTFIKKDTVLFHRCKDSSLIDLLGMKRNIPGEFVAMPSDPVLTFAALNEAERLIREPAEYIPEPAPLTNHVIQSCVDAVMSGEAIAALVHNPLVNHGSVYGPSVPIPNDPDYASPLSPLQIKKRGRPKKALSAT